VSNRRKPKTSRHQLKAKAARMPAAGANMRFGCNTCGHIFERDMSIMIADVTVTNLDTGEVTNPMDGGTWRSPCPRCGQPAPSINHVTVRDGEHTVHGFANTAEDVDAIRSSIDELRKLKDDASAEEVAAVLEQQGLGAIAQYVRDHHVALAALGVSLAALVIQILAWLQPVAPDEQNPEPVPDGITYDQMERLVEELREEVGSGKKPADGGDQKPKQRQVDPSGAEEHGRDKRGGTRK
jgi:hypothetical protein